MSISILLEPGNGTSFGKRVFAGIIKEFKVILDDLHGS
jgi:hypothetical protein